eukprot:364098-Chlamydomonas_euryale.AAC.3
MSAGKGMKKTQAGSDWTEPPSSIMNGGKVSTRTAQVCAAAGVSGPTALGSTTAGRVRALSAR